MEMTAAQLAGMIAEQIKEATGKSFAEFKSEQAEAEAKRKADDEVQRKHTADIAASTMNKDYAEKAKNVIAADPHKGVGLKFARNARAVALGQKTGKSAKDVALSWGDRWLADDIDASEKALASQTGSAGGFMITPQYAEEVIELLRSQAVVLRAGAVIYPMQSGQLTFARQGAAATANYVGENVNIPSSQLSMEQIQLVMKKCAAITAVSNDLLRQASPMADQIIRDDLIAVIALRADLAFLRGDGTSGTPKGFLSRINSSNQNARTQATSPSTLAEITSDLFKAQRLVKAANIQLNRGAWFMSTRTAYGIMQMRDGLGNLAFAPEMRTGKLLGWPYYESNQIPENLGSGSNKSEVYFAEMSQVVVGDTMQVSVEVYNGGAYYDSTTSAVISGISQDQTVLKSMSEHDIVLRHDKAGAVINTIDWGV